MNKNNKMIWRFTSSKMHFPNLLTELHATNVLSASEVDALNEQINGAQASKPRSKDALIGVTESVTVCLNFENSDLYDVVVDLNLENFNGQPLLPFRKNMLSQFEPWLRECSEDEIVVLYIIEPDDLSKIRGILGHAVSESILFQFLKRLEKFDQYPCKPFRMHGDSVGLVLRGLPEIEHAWKVGSWLEGQFQAPYVTPVGDIYMAPSIGFSAIPYVANDLNELLHTAYIALHKAQKDPNHACHIYESIFADNLSRSLSLESELNSALRSGQGCEAFYQPKLDLKTDKIIGMEALIRWRHPKHGLLSPAQFIPIAERSSLICDITDHMLHIVCKDISSLRKMGFLGRVSVNISARDFSRQDFVSDICRIIRLHDIEPSNLELEITEGALIHDFSRCCLILSILREKGFTLSIDDFGKGYSSLSYLEKLPVDVLKIDKDFIHNIEKSNDVRTVFTALLQIAHTRKLEVLAEGVENLEQKEVLRSMDCDLIQGYLLSKPMPLDQCRYLPLR